MLLLKVEKFQYTMQSLFYLLCYVLTIFHLTSLICSLSSQAPSVRLLGRVLHQVSVLLGITASPGLRRPHQRTEGRQVTRVLKATTVRRAPQRRCPVPQDITATKPRTATSPPACPVLQVDADAQHA